MSLPVSQSLPVTSARIVFPRLQHGRYQVWLDRDGRLYGSTDAEVGEHPATVTVNERSIEEELAGELPLR